MGSPQLYNRDATRDIQVQAIGETAEIQYGRLPCYAWLLKPLGSLPYRLAYVLWIVLQLSAFIGFIALWPGATTARRCLICCWFLPAFIGLFNGQDDLLLLLWVALAFRSLRAGRSVLAGMLLTLCASKFHLFALVPLVIVAQRRWRMAGAMALSAGILLALSFAAAGLTWPARYWAVLADQRMNTGLAHMPNLHALFDFGDPGLILQLAVTLSVCAGLFFAARRSSDFETPFAIALVGGVLLGFHAYLADTVLFLPALMVLSRGTCIRLVATILITPVPWFFLELANPLPALTQSLLLAFAGISLVSLARGQKTGSELLLERVEPVFQI